MPPKLKIVSWNVAGWSKTLEEIRRHCKTLTAWMQRHEIDILCLQEVKGNLQKLESSDSQQLFASKEPGYDSFFNLCTGNSDGGTPGFNGVATFCKNGLTLRANAAALQDAELDAQGRCLVTDHGEFVLFNVYAPFDGAQAARLDLKMRFLLALQAAMRRALAAGKRLVLAGDLNLKYRVQDVCAAARRIDLEKLLQFHSDDPSAPAMVGKLQTVLKHSGLEAIKRSIAEMEIQEFGAPIDKKGTRKVRVLARHPETNALKRLNPGELWLPEQAAAYAPLSGAQTRDGLHVARRANTLNLEELKLFTEELLDLKWTREDFEELAAYEHGGWLYAGALCTKHWMEDIVLGEFGLVDSFAATHARIEERYTVWNTRTNERYNNAGSRLDYICVDAGLFQEQTSKLYGCDCSNNTCEKPKVCGLQASTAFGRWQPAPMHGGGLPESTSLDFETQFACSGAIIYTSPTCSDHVAVSCILTLPATFTADLVLDSKDAGTKAARPYAKQMSLADFGIGRKKPRLDADRSANA